MSGIQVTGNVSQTEVLMSRSYIIQLSASGMKVELGRINCPFCSACLFVRSFIHSFFSGCSTCKLHDNVFSGLG